ncbi:MULTISPECIES: mechanosensitive ion channel family protein [unclassified Methylophaga]|jgi:small-conductance mechanosensitive channel|nr:MULTISPECIES: mechanosensitive ion channel domain-containing protein [unclassified Methylophaga]MAP26118.1 potassium transporter KefA [Methylophaga sp.]HCO01533.1 potassium transporter KefA [Methylophaga sp.]|tara:strand:+ start:9332 stop:10231 length:900 start_codon:yes stop_codon:yes gene_type:complete
MNEFDYYWDIFIRWMTTPIMGSDSGITISNMLGFVLIVFVAWWASAKVEKILQRMTLGKSYRHIDDSTFYLISRLFRYFIWISATLVGLSYIGFNLTGLAFIGGAIGVGIGFGLQNIVSNFISGIILILEKSLKVGDFIEISNSTTGIVQEIGLRYTRITTRDNIDILVPNSEFINGQVTNWSFSEKLRRIHVPFGVAYGVDKDLVREAALEAASHVPGAITGDPGKLAEVWLTEFGDSSLNFELVIWVGNELMSRPARTKALFLWEIETQLRAKDIEIPFPQRDLHIRSGKLAVSIEQ